MTKSKPFRGSTGRSMALGSNDPRSRREGLSDNDFGKGLEVGRDGRVCVKPAKGGAKLDVGGVTLEEIAMAYNDLQARLHAANLMEK